MQLLSISQHPPARAWATSSGSNMRFMTNAASGSVRSPLGRPLAASAAAVLRRLPTQFGLSEPALLVRPSSGRPHARRCGPVKVSAMVNVDVSPSVVLGVGLIGAGVSLWQIRRVKPWISKDYDVVVSCISLLVGGILIFQGWRLDPLLLFGQLMTTGAAVSFAVEALKLRSEQYENEEKAALQDVTQRKGPGGDGSGGAFQLPPPDPLAAAQPWADSGVQQQQPWADPQEAAQQPWQQAQQVSQGFWDNYQQQQPGPSGAYDPPPQQQQQQYGGTADGQWYYGGNPGPYQVADYVIPDPADGATGGDVGSSSSGGGYYAGGDVAGDSSSQAGSGMPAEFVFPASYEDGSAAGAQSSGGAWSGTYGSSEQPQQLGSGQGGQQQQWGGQPGLQQQPPAAPGRRPGSSWDMDDW